MRGSFHLPRNSLSTGWSWDVSFRAVWISSRILVWSSYKIRNDTYLRDLNSLACICWRTRFYHNFKIEFCQLVDLSVTFRMVCLHGVILNLRSLQWGLLYHHLMLGSLLFELSDGVLADGSEDIELLTCYKMRRQEVSVDGSSQSIIVESRREVSKDSLAINANLKIVNQIHSER